eukprot:3248474-Pyramimonas_sp.AAC.1
MLVPKTGSTQPSLAVRRGRGTADAIHMVRRHIEFSNIRNNSGSTSVALDWKKAFDSITVEAMLTALGRF